MTGRELFQKNKKSINATIRMLQIVSPSIRIWLWNCANRKKGRIGVLLRYLCLSSLIRSCGENVYIGEDVEVRHFENLSIGNNVSIHKGCYIDALSSIVIGDSVSIAHACSLISFEHSWRDETKPIKYNDLVLKPIKICNDVWVGCGCRILAGVEIGERCIIAAGAVVVSDVATRTIVGGVPAKKISTLDSVRGTT